jgi:hypothetical protein
MKWDRSHKARREDPREASSPLNEEFRKEAFVRTTDSPGAEQLCVESKCSTILTPNMLGTPKTINTPSLFIYLSLH